MDCCYAWRPNLSEDVGCWDLRDREGNAPRPTNWCRRCIGLAQAAWGNDRIAQLEADNARLKAQYDEKLQHWGHAMADNVKLRAQLARAEAVCEAAEEGLKGDMDLLRVRQPVVQALAAWRVAKGKQNDPTP